jgi:hypothetical protein
MLELVGKYDKKRASRKVDSKREKLYKGVSLMLRRRKKRSKTINRYSQYFITQLRRPFYQNRLVEFWISKVIV